MPGAFRRTYCSVRIPNPFTTPYYPPTTSTFLEPSTLATIVVAEFGDYSRQCGQGFMEHNSFSPSLHATLPTHPFPISEFLPWLRVTTWLKGVTHTQETCTRKLYHKFLLLLLLLNVYQKPAPMHVSKIVRFYLSAVCESFWCCTRFLQYKFLDRVSSD